MAMKEITNVEDLASVKKIVYASVKLTQDSKDKLLVWCLAQKFLLPEIKSHHMTIVFNPSKDVVAKLPLGQEVKLKVVGYAEDDKAQAVVVECDVPSNNVIKHITISHQPDVKPVYSNELLARGYKDVDGPLLTGIVVAFGN
jgi:hypothetical protein